MDQIRRLGAPWYADRLDPAWRPKTVERMRELIAAAGLTGPFWDVG